MTVRDVAHRACMAKMRNSLLLAPSFPTLYFPFLLDLWWTKWHRDEFYHWELRFSRFIPRCSTLTFYSCNYQLIQHVSLTCPHFPVSNFMWIFYLSDACYMYYLVLHEKVLWTESYVKTVAYSSSSSYITMLSCYCLPLRPSPLLEPICCQHPPLLSNLEGGGVGINLK